MPFAEASRVLARIGQIHVSSTTVWRQTQAQGVRLQAYQQRRQAQGSVERTRWEDRRYDPQARIGISMDGGMVAIRGEGWKEVKIGSIGQIERRWTAEGQAVRLTNLHYTGVLGDVDTFQSAFWELATRCNVLYAGQTVVTADGAGWIWRVAQHLFPCSTQIVDWYHANQHLAQAVSAQHPTDAQAASESYRVLQGWLFQGTIEPIIAALKPIGDGKHHGYFQDHKRRMQYQEFCEMGYPIGSGSVESGVKQFKHRLTAAGMRWSRPAAERMIILRAAVLSDTFHSLWHAAA